MSQLEFLFSLLSEPVRLKLLVLLSDGERCVCELYGSLALQQSTVSRHLAMLRNAGIVSTRRSLQWVHYRLTLETLPSDWQQLITMAIAAAKAQYPDLVSVEDPCCIPLRVKNVPKRKTAKLRD